MGYHINLLVESEARKGGVGVAKDVVHVMRSGLRVHVVVMSETQQQIKTVTSLWNPILLDLHKPVTSV